jgi:transcription antitermination factor NusA-like protein
MECFKYYLPISVGENKPLGLTFTISDNVAGKIIGFNGYNIRRLRKIYNAEFKINGCKNENEREVNITGEDKFKVYQEVLKYMVE